MVYQKRAAVGQMLIPVPSTLRHAYKESENINEEHLYSSFLNVV